MQTSCRASRRIDFGRPLALLTPSAATALLSGCASEGVSTLAGTPAWLAALVLLLVAGLAYALGQARSQLHARRRQPAPAAAPLPPAAAADDRGAHAAFGAAKSMAADSGLAGAADSRLVSALLGAQPGAAVVAMAAGDGSWQVPLANAAARALWPRLNWPASLQDVAAQLPPPAAAATLAAAAAEGPGAVAGGWLVEPFGASALAAHQGLLLVQQTGAGDGSRASEGDSFSFTAAHDLRAPIRVVEGFTRIVKEDYGHLLDRVGNDHLDRVLGAAARMNLMIDALLTLARLSQQPLARQPVNLSQLAGFIVDDLRRGEPGREADVEIEPELSAMGDPTLLRLVLENLLGNAWKYSARAARSQVSLRSVPHAGGVAYVVRDNGAGFDMRSADRLFGLFQRLHSASEFPGHGVGLASVRRIVHRHGGEIWAEAEPGRGAAFYFTLGQ